MASWYGLKLLTAIYPPYCWHSSITDRFCFVSSVTDAPSPACTSIVIALEVREDTVICVFSPVNSPSSVSAPPDGRRKRPQNIPLAQRTVVSDSPARTMSYSHCPPFCTGARLLTVCPPDLLSMTLLFAFAANVPE